MSLGGVVGLVVNFLIVGLMYGVVAVTISRFINFANSNLGMFPQDTLNTLFWISLIFLAFPFLYVLGLMYNHWVNEQSETGGWV